MTEWHIALSTKPGKPSCLLDEHIASALTAPCFENEAWKPLSQTLCTPVEPLRRGSCLGVLVATIGPAPDFSPPSLGSLAPVFPRNLVASGERKNAPAFTFTSSGRNPRADHFQIVKSGRYIFALPDIAEA